MPFTNREFEIELQFKGVNSDTVLSHMARNSIPTVRNRRVKITDWLAKQVRNPGFDSSVTALLSPILSGNDGLNQVKNVIRFIFTNSTSPPA